MNRRRRRSRPPTRRRPRRGRPDRGHRGPDGGGQDDAGQPADARFYEIDAGRVLVDGIDTREMTRDSLRRTFGMVLQDTWLFHGTIRENIAYGRDGTSEEQIVGAAEAAHVDRFVRTLPAGYDTVIDDDASNLSAGEKQLLTIARAFLADPPILIGRPAPSRRSGARGRRASRRYASG